MAAQQQWSVDLALGRTPEVDDPKMFQELLKVYNALTNLAQALDFNVGASLPSQEEMAVLLANNSVLVGRQSRVFAKALEPIPAGAVVNLQWSGSFHQVSLANATNGVERRARGFNPAAAVTTGQFMEVQLLGLCTAYGGLTVDTTYYTSTTAGIITATPPNSGSHLIQPVGFAIHPNMIFFNPSIFVSRAPV